MSGGWESMMACLLFGCKQTDANSITGLHLDVPGAGNTQCINRRGGGRDHLLLNTGGGDLNYLLADKTNHHKQVREMP